MEKQSTPQRVPVWIRKLLTKKFLIKFTILLVLTPFVTNFPLDETTRIIHSHLWALASLAFLIAGTIKISAKNPEGWLWLAYFFFAGAFGQIGIVSWVYLIIAGLFISVWFKWNKPEEENHGMGL